MPWIVAQTGAGLGEEEHQTPQDESPPPFSPLQEGRKCRFFRVGLVYRALGTECPQGILWFWIGDHAEYDRITG